MTEPNSSVASLGASDNESDKPPSENQAVVNVTPPHRGPGLLDLPTEVRLIIFRHLLVLPSNKVFYLPNQNHKDDLAILETSKLFYREASDVLYKENTFHICPTALSPQMMDKVQNIETSISLVHIDELRRPITKCEVDRFLDLIRLVGNQSIIRGSLSVQFLIKTLFLRLLKWFIRALGRFTNFRTVEFWFTNEFESLYHRLNMREYLRTALKPVLGPAEDFEKMDRFGRAVKGLTFHPVNHHLLVRPDGGDWADSLDGIRLEWN